MPHKHPIFFLAALFLILFACKKEEPPVKTIPRTELQVEVKYVYGDNFGQSYYDSTSANYKGDFYLNHSYYHHYYRSLVRFSAFRNYIGRFTFVDTLGNKYVSNEGYHLLDAGDTSTHTFVIEDIPAGVYADIVVTYGVDSATCKSGPYQGDLDPGNGMFWDPEKGFINIHAKGILNTSTAMYWDRHFEYNLGGYKGDSSTVRQKGLEQHYLSPFTLNDEKKSTLTIQLNVKHIANSAYLHDIEGPSQRAANKAAAFSNGYINTLEQMEWPQEEEDLE